MGSFATNFHGTRAMKTLQTHQERQATEAALAASTVKLDENSSSSGGGGGVGCEPMGSERAPSSFTL